MNHLQYFVFDEGMWRLVMKAVGVRDGGRGNWNGQCGDTVVRFVFGLVGKKVVGRG